MSDRKAIGLYAVLARDWGDFIDMCGDADDDTLRTLYAMLTTPNPKHDRRTTELNALGAELVAPMLKGRTTGGSQDKPSATPSEPS